MRKHRGGQELKHLRERGCSMNTSSFTKIQQKNEERRVLFHDNWQLADELRDLELYPGEIIPPLQLPVEAGAFYIQRFNKLT